MRRISVFISKGGTAKTTTAVNLAVGLASKGNRVMLVDGDPQGGVSAYFSIPPTRGLADLLIGEEVELVKVRDGLVVMTAGGKHLLEVIGRLENQRSTYEHVERAFNKLSELDYVIFDCSPSMGFLNYNILHYADMLLLPVSLDYLTALEAVETINNVRQDPRLPNVSVLGVLPTFYDRRTRMGRVLLRMIREHFGELVTETIIRTNTKINEAPSHQMAVTEYDRRSYGAADYANLIDEIELRCTALEKNRVQSSR